MLTNLVILQILIPLIGALICFLLPKRFTWLFASFILLSTSLISLLLFKAALGSQPIFYHLGGWSSSIGIEYKLDKLNALFILIVSVLSFINILGMRSLISHELDETKYPLFFGILLLAITGLLGVAISNDIFNIYVLLEVNAIASYALVASAQKTEAKRAAFDYLIFGTIGSSFILLGIGFIYALVGSLNLTDISQVIPNFFNNKAAIAGMGLIVIGILMKAALFPLSKWLVNVYQAAPSFISALLAATSNKIGIYLLLRFFFDVFKLDQYSFEYLEISLMAIAVLAIFTCAILALRQTDIKRFLAYSSLSQIGFIVLAIALASNLAISGALIYSMTHALEKTALFLAIGYLIAFYTSSEEMTSFAGIARTQPWICVLIIINLLSTVGVPMTAGFVGKWQILKAALASDIWYILIISIAILFTFSYAFKFVELLIFQQADYTKKHLSTRETDKSEKQFLQPNRYILCVWIITLITFINLYIGFNHQYILNIANQISHILVK